MYLVDAEKDSKNRHRTYHPKSLSKNVENSTEATAIDRIGAGVDVDEASQQKSVAKCVQRDQLSFNPFSKIIGFRKTMAATDGQIILAASRFGDITPAYLRDFSKTELPAIAKIVKGQHQNLGVPTLSNPSLQSTALFLNAGKKYQILAQPIKIKEGRKPTNVGEYRTEVSSRQPHHVSNPTICSIVSGPKILIPETYLGYFELLSEDGRSTRCIENVLDLSRKPNFRVLVRETFRCNHLNRTIHAGEILTTMYENGKYLKCKTLKEEIINLPLEAKAKFSPIAKEDSISGVHTVKNLLKKRMPVVVR